MRILGDQANPNYVGDGVVRAAEQECELITPGEDTYYFRLPNGQTFESELQPNNSTTLTIRGSNGVPQFSWNSGTFLTCFVLGAGVGLAVTSYTRNSRLGALATTLTSLGCTKALNSTTEDGDDYLPPC